MRCELVRDKERLISTNSESAHAMTASRRGRSQKRTLAAFTLARTALELLRKRNVRSASMPSSATNDASARALSPHRADSADTSFALHANEDKRNVLTLSLRIFFIAYVRHCFVSFDSHALQHSVECAGVEQRRTSGCVLHRRRCDNKRCCRAHRRRSVTQQSNDVSRCNFSSERANKNNKERQKFTDNTIEQTRSAYKCCA